MTDRSRRVLVSQCASGHRSVGVSYVPGLCNHASLVEIDEDTGEVLVEEDFCDAPLSVKLTPHTKELYQFAWNIDELPGKMLIRAKEVTEGE